MLKFITGRPLWVNILVAIVLTLALFFLFIISLKWLTHHDQAKIVPLVMGKTLEQAEQELKNAGFEIEIQDSIYNDAAGPGVIVKQIPEADELVKINRTVYLTVNRTVAPMIDMPNLVSYSFRTAEMTLKNANLRVGDTIYRPDFARNAVLEQRYEGAAITPGTKIRMGSKVDLVLGNGVSDRQFVVPSLVGMTYCQAKGLLEANGLAFGVVMGNSITDTCNSYIYKQSPERMDEEKRFRYIRSGQLMDVWLQTDKPVLDTTNSVQ